MVEDLRVANIAAIKEADAFNSGLKTALERMSRNAGKRVRRSVVLPEHVMIKTVDDGRHVCHYFKESDLDEEGYRKVVAYYLSEGLCSIARFYAGRAKERFNAEIEIPENKASRNPDAWI